MSETLRCTVRDGDGPVAVATVSGDLDMDTVPDLSAVAHDLLTRGHHALVLDMSEVSFCDSSGLNVLIGVWRRAQDSGATLALASVPDRLERLLDITGMAPLLPTHATVVEAVRAAGR